MGNNKRQPWLIRDIAYLYILSFVLCVCFVLTVSFLTGVAVEELSSGYILITVWLFHITALSILIFFVKRVYGAKFQDIGLTVNNISQGIIYGLCVGLILSVLIYLLSLFGLDPFPLFEDDLVLDVDAGFSIYNVAFVGMLVLSSVVEIIVFIGFTYTILTKRFKKNMAVFLVCFFYALLRVLMAPKIDIKVFFMLFVFIFILVYLYDRTRTLVAPMVAVSIVYTIGLVLDCPDYWAYFLE